MNAEKPSAFADLLFGLFWLALAIAIVVGSWQMDRLAHLQANPYSVPGIVPGILGAAIALMGAALILRSVGAGALTQIGLGAIRFADHWRVLTTLTLCLVFVIGAVGHGLPFWAAAAGFIAIFVFIFQCENRRTEGTLLRGAAFAVAFGLIGGFAIYYVFQELFLVRLP
jgi:hypothetical protein